MTIVRPLYQMGEAAIGVFLQLIKAPDLKLEGGVGRRVALKAELRVRESTGRSAYFASHCQENSIPPISKSSVSTEAEA
jgi:hypothetical protein